MRYSHAMALHLLKLCVGADSIRDLEDWIAARLALAGLNGQAPEHIHTTRMAPRRAEELLEHFHVPWNRGIPLELIL